MSSKHTVGAGATGGEAVVVRQWFALWGLVPLGGTPDSRTLGGNRLDYTVHTWDTFLNLVCGWIGFYRNHVEVEF